MTDLTSYMNNNTGINSSDENNYPVNILTDQEICLTLILFIYLF